MGNDKRSRALCLALLVLLLVPLVGMFVFGASDAVSNERLAAKPKLVRAGKLNVDVFSETADYFAGRFFGRPALITANSAVSYLVFTLLYTPCVAAIAAIRREVGSAARAAVIAVSQCCVAWLAAYAVFAVLGL